METFNQTWNEYFTALHGDGYLEDQAKPVQIPSSVATGTTNGYGASHVVIAPVHTYAKGVGAFEATYSLYQAPKAVVGTGAPLSHHSQTPKGLPNAEVTAPTNAETAALVAAANTLLQADGFNTYFAVETSAVTADILPNTKYDVKGAEANPEKVAKASKSSMIDFFDLITYDDELEAVQHNPYLDAVALIEFYHSTEGAALLGAIKASKAKAKAKASNAMHHGAQANANQIKKIKKLLAAGKTLPKHLAAMASA